ncbi:oxygenase MpaB family protein [Gordonia sp. 'Campus']|uniref:oxygenase MpaB family protein n=1 Tax=Gordonia sp. 'Campus' TaxID=2915824 RepID=UPI001EE3AE42|nr:oxygenase MpaB family protein [Gordonia sp. 'Campus']
MTAARDLPEREHGGGPVADTYQHDLVARRKPTARRRPVRRPADLVTAIGPTLAGANVIMQLANPKVGYGVHESRVPSGNAIKRPIKRGRTTGTFLAVALMGNESDKAYIHEAVGRIHDQVYSTETSPVRYSANDSRLQLWVAICLLKYFIDQYELLHGPLTAEEKQTVLTQAHPLGTALNVPADKWPATYDDLLVYWNGELAGLRIDKPVRDELRSLADLSFLEYRVGKLGTLAHVTLGPSLAYAIKAGLPPEFREMMRWRWTERDERRYQRALVGFRLVDPVLAPVLRGVFRLNLLDLRLRRKLGIPVF